MIAQLGRYRKQGLFVIMIRIHVLLLVLWFVTALV